MDFSYSPEDERFLQELRAWLTNNKPARAERVPHDDASLAAEVAFLRAWQRSLHAAGYVGLLWPREYGGRGARPTQQAILNQELARARAPQLLNRVGVNNTGPTLIAHGSEAQKRRFLPPILSADELWCQLFSEPGAGSDLAALRTRAEPDGDGFVVSGQKVWTSYAQFSRWAILLARTDPSLPKHRGLTYFVLDMESPGVTIRPLRQLTGSTEFSEVFLDAVRARHGFRLQGAGAAADRGRAHGPHELPHADAPRARRGAGARVVAREALLGEPDAAAPPARARAGGILCRARRRLAARGRGRALAAGVPLVARGRDRGRDVRGAGEHHRAADPGAAAVRRRGSTTNGTSASPTSGTSAIQRITLRQT